MYVHWRDGVDLGGGGGDGGVKICGHGQGVMRTQPVSLAGGLGEGAGRLGPALGEDP